MTKSKQAFKNCVYWCFCGYCIHFVRAGLWGAWVPQCAQRSQGMTVWSEFSQPWGFTAMLDFYAATGNLRHLSLKKQNKTLLSEGKVHYIFSGSLVCLH